MKTGMTVWYSGIESVVVSSDSETVVIKPVTESMFPGGATTKTLWVEDGLEELSSTAAEQATQKTPSPAPGLPGYMRRRYSYGSGESSHITSKYNPGYLKDD